LMESLDIKYEVLDTEHTSFIKGRVGRIALGQEKIAFIGELHPQVLLNWSIEMPVSVLELNITELYRLMNFPETAEKSKQQPKIVVHKESHKIHKAVHKTRKVHKARAKAKHKRK